MKRNVGYLRVATRHPLGAAFILELQREATLSAVKEGGHVIDEWVSDEAVPGTEPLPLGLAAILRRAERGEIGRVWVYGVDRLSRHPETLGELMTAFEEAGVDLRLTS